MRCVGRVPLSKEGDDLPSRQEQRGGSRRLLREMIIKYIKPRVGWGGMV